MPPLMTGLRRVEPPCPKGAGLPPPAGARAHCRAEWKVPLRGFRKNLFQVGTVHSGEPSAPEVELHIYLFTAEGWAVCRGMHFMDIIRVEETEDDKTPKCLTRYLRGTH